MKCPHCKETLIKTAPDCFEHKGGCGPCPQEIEATIRKTAKSRPRKEKNNAKAA